MSLSKKIIVSRIVAPRVKLLVFIHDNNNTEAKYNTTKTKAYIEQQFLTSKVAVKSFSCVGHNVCAWTKLTVLLSGIL